MPRGNQTDGLFCHNNVLQHSNLQDTDQISREESKEHFEVKDLQLLSVSWNCHS